MQFLTDILTPNDIPFIKRLIAIQVVEITQEKNKKTKELEEIKKVYGEAVVCLQDLFEHGRTDELGYNLFEEGKNTKSALKGNMMIRNCSLRKFYTFLDLHFQNNLNIVPIVAVDFSLANLTFDENMLCLHSLKPG